MPAARIRAITDAALRLHSTPHIDARQEHVRKHTHRIVIYEDAMQAYMMKRRRRHIKAAQRRMPRHPISRHPQHTTSHHTARSSLLQTTGILSAFHRPASHIYHGISHTGHIICRIVETPIIYSLSPLSARKAFLHTLSQLSSFSFSSHTDTVLFTL